MIVTTEIPISRTDANSTKGVECSDGVTMNDPPLLGQFNWNGVMERQSIRNDHETGQLHVPSYVWRA